MAFRIILQQSLQFLTTVSLFALRHIAVKDLVKFRTHPHHAGWKPGRNLEQLLALATL
jgi:hypothetical protein